MSRTRVRPPIRSPVCIRKQPKAHHIRLQRDFVERPTVAGFTRSTANHRLANDPPLVKLSLSRHPFSQPKSCFATSPMSRTPLTPVTNEIARVVSQLVARNVVSTCNGGCGSPRASLSRNILGSWPRILGYAEAKLRFWECARLAGESWRVDFRERHLLEGKL